MLTAAWSLAFLIGTAVSQREQFPKPEPREVLALTSAHDDDRERQHDSIVHMLLQMPLNHLGMTVRIHALKNGEPPPVDASRTRAVLLHLADWGDVLPGWLWPWLERQQKIKGLRFVHMGSLELLRTKDAQRLQKWLDGFGLSLPANAVDNPLRICWQDESGGHYPFEAPPWSRIHNGVSIPQRHAARGHRVWLSTHDRREPSKPRYPIVTGDFGGIALDPWVFTSGSGTGDRRWHVDPFAFFAAALGCEHLPAPDPSVSHGRRKFLLHVDGDGFESVSTVEKGVIAAEVFADRVVDRFRIPMTVSIIVRSVTDDIANPSENDAMKLTRRMFAVPWVEPASHAVLHPLDWRRTKHPRSLPRTVTWYEDLANYKHTMRREVTDSVRFINKWLCASDKPCRVMLWTGAANPSADVVAACREVGCVNLNGGVYRFDDSSPSLGYVVPWGLSLGGEFQVFCGAANENVFDGFYSDLPSAFGHIDTTLERTGSPRILKPANLYVHFYSVEALPRLETLLALIVKWAEARATIPVYASHYAMSVDDAQNRVRIARTERGFRFEDIGHCTTMRVDQPPGAIDWRHSPGLLGANTIQGSLYLHISRNGGEVAFSEGCLPQPHLVESDHLLRELRRDARSVAFVSQAFRDRVVVLGGFPSNAVVDCLVDAEARVLRCDAAGQVKLTLTGEAPQAIKVSSR